MIRRLSSALTIAMTCVFGLVATAWAAPTPLVLSQSAAFSVLGHWCGGIQEKVYATGWDAVTGDPVGDVYMSTRCGGSGRDGGGRSTTYSAWAGVTWSFAGATVSYTKLAQTPTVNPTFSAYDAHGDQLYNQATAGVLGGTQVSNQADLVVLVPAAPSNVTVARSGGQLKVSWSDDSTAPPALITSSTVTATPVGSGSPAFTATASGITSTALLGPLEPDTTYQITVLSTDAAGASPSSAAVSMTTGASTIRPGPPTGLSAHWTAPGSPGDRLVASWRAGRSGDSPTDRYEIRISGSDGGGTFTQYVTGWTLTARFSVTDIPDWAIKVRAHDTAGWGSWSASHTLGGT